MSLTRLLFKSSLLTLFAFVYLQIIWKFILHDEIELLPHLLISILLPVITFWVTEKTKGQKREAIFKHIAIGSISFLSCSFFILEGFSSHYGFFGTVPQKRLPSYHEDCEKLLTNYAIKNGSNFWKTETESTTNKNYIKCKRNEVEFMELNTPFLRKHFSGNTFQRPLWLLLFLTSLPVFSWLVISRTKKL